MTAGHAQARGFVLHASAFMAHGKRPSVKISAEIPYSSLVFLKENGRFMSHYNISVTITDVKSKDVVRTAVFHGDAVAEYYEDTHSREQRAQPSKTIALAPGEYTIEAILGVKNTLIQYQRVTRVVVPDFLASGIGFGTPEVYFLPFTRGQRVVRRDEFDKRDRLKRADAEMVGLNVLDAQPVVQFEMFLNEDPEAPLICVVYYEVRATGGDRILYGRSRARLTGADDVFILTFDAENWKPGAYTINLRAMANKGQMDANTSSTIQLDVTHAMLGEYFEDTLEILSLIASNDELHALETTSPEMRAEEWRKFWRRRDPNPDTVANEALEELLRRVRIAGQRYAKFGTGWRSDRGRVYIRHGEPDRIERTADRINRGEYEVWSYLGLNRTYVFYAQNLGSEYRLIEGDPF